MNYKSFLIFIVTCLCMGRLYAQSFTSYGEALVKRVVPKYQSSFRVEAIDSQNQKDVFEIESVDHKVVLRGSSGVAIASALYRYLNDYCGAQITWNGVNLNLTKSLPMVKGKIRNVTPYEYRYNLNYCTFSYSMAWWDWERWEKEIDWMALHGINMPLAITGQEYTWYLVYKEMGLKDDDLKDFFTGPAYFGWFWMGNMDSWGGPLPVSWMKSHFELQKKILDRQRSLGMKPVLPAFTGHVPASFKKIFPQAKLKATNWHNGFADTYILDAEDPLFIEVGKKFLEKQTALMGTDHLYSADTFNENEPPSDDPGYLGKLSARVYDGMKSADPKAVWIMQGWLFYSDRKFWKEPQTKALLDAVPNENMIILDLASEIEPVWKRTQSFYGKPWIWNMLHNFGGNTNLFGRMEVVAKEPANALNDPQRGNLKGIGLTMEGIEQNPVMYELMTANIWRNTSIDLDIWLPAYVKNRYRSTDKSALKAWDILRNTVYKVPANKYIRDGSESIIQGRPTLKPDATWVKTKLNYEAKDLLPAWDELIKATANCKNSDGFQYDLVDLSRQVMANYALPLQQSLAKAYKDKDLAGFQSASARFITLIEDLDRLLGSRRDFLLGPWISDARGWGTNPAEKNLYEVNAKNLITLWGGANSPLHEYSCRQWSGLLSDFYKPRWEKFFIKASQAIAENRELDIKSFENEIKEWEWQWVNKPGNYPVKTKGDPVKISMEMYNKYRKIM